MDKTFGDFIRKKRLKNKLTLRSFCNRFGYDTAYISRLENDKIPPFKSKDKLSILANALGIEKNTKDWVKYFDLAYQARKELPPDIKKDASEVIDILPAFLRKPDGKKIKKSRIRELITFLTEGEDIGNRTRD